MRRKFLVGVASFKVCFIVRWTDRLRLAASTEFATNRGRLWARLIRRFHRAFFKRKSILGAKQPESIHYRPGTTFLLRDNKLYVAVKNCVEYTFVFRTTEQGSTVTQVDLS